MASSEDLITRLIEQTGVNHAVTQPVLRAAGETKRLHLLIDGGGTWTQAQVRSLLALRARLDAGLIVAARQPQHWGEVGHDLGSWWTRAPCTRSWPVVARPNCGRRSSLC